MVIYIPIAFIIWLCYLALPETKQPAQNKMVDAMNNAELAAIELKQYCEANNITAEQVNTISGHLCMIMRYNKPVSFGGWEYSAVTVNGVQITDIYAGVWRMYTEQTEAMGLGYFDKGAFSSYKVSNGKDKRLQGSDRKKSKEFRMARKNRHN